MIRLWAPEVLIRPTRPVLGWAEPLPRHLPVTGHHPDQGGGRAHQGAPGTRRALQASFNVKSLRKFHNYNILCNNVNMFCLLYSIISETSSHLFKFLIPLKIGRFWERIKGMNLIFVFCVSVSKLIWSCWNFSHLIFKICRIRAQDCYITAKCATIEPPAASCSCCLLVLSEKPRVKTFQESQSGPANTSQESYTVMYSTAKSHHDIELDVWVQRAKSKKKQNRERKLSRVNKTISDHE